MTKECRHLFGFSVLAAMAMMFFSCATQPILRIEYELPPKTDVLSGIRVGVEVADQRQDLELLDKSAKHELKNFSKDIAFSVLPGEETLSIAMYDLSTLVKTTLKKQLENMGAYVLDEPGPDDPVLKVILQRFLLTYAERTWYANVKYEAQLVKDEPGKGQKVLAREIMDGKGERMKIIGRTEADRVVTDTYTDTMNQLHVEDLFRRAELIK